MASCTPTAPVPATIGDVSHAAATATSGLAGATGERRVLVWDTRTWEHHTTWDAVPGFGVDSMVFTPDSDFLVTGGAGSAAIWNVREAPRAESSSRWIPAGATRACWSASVTTGLWSPSPTAPEWDVAAGRLPEHACTIVGRNLTRQEWADVLPDRRHERTCPQYPAGS